MFGLFLMSMGYKKIFLTVLRTNLKNDKFLSELIVFLVGVARLELAASKSQKVLNAQYIALFSSFMCFLLQNMEPRGAL